MAALGQGGAPIPGPTPGRGNGLEAASYIAIADLDPHLADAMLDALREEGVAAYAVPITHRHHGDFTLPRYRRLLDRLHVDSAAAEQARELLDERLPELMADFHGSDEQVAEPEERPTDDEIWASIVAAYDSAVADPVPRWPVNEDLPAEDGPPGRVVRRVGSAEPEDAAAAAEDAAAAANRADVSEKSTEPVSRDGQQEAPPAVGPQRAAEDHYVPPPPPPLPTADTLTRFAWAGVVGAPLFFIIAVVINMRVANWMVVLAIAAFVGGFVTLVARMKDRPPDDDSGPDDGAVV